MPFSCVPGDRGLLQRLPPFDANTPRPTSARNMKLTMKLTRFKGFLTPQYTGQYRHNYLFANELCLLTSGSRRFKPPSHLLPLARLPPRVMLTTSLTRTHPVPKTMNRIYLTSILVFLLIATAASALPLDLLAARFQTPGLERVPGRTVFSGSAQVGEYLQIADSNVYPVVVSAAGQPASDRWPQLALLVDGLPIQTVEIRSGEPRDYTLRANLTAGLHQLSLALVNAVQGGDNLRITVFSARIDVPEGAAPPALADLKEWRAEARRREAAALAHADEVIQRSRKADAVVRVLDAAGNPLPNVAVQITQQRHAFLFGCNLFQLNRLPDPQNLAYSDAFTAVFNYATLPFYWAYEPQLAGAPRQSLLDFCREHGLAAKGHPLLWNTPYGWPPGASALPDEASLRQHVEQILRQYSPAIAYWDVLSEPVTAPGSPLAAFAWARQAAPSARLLINEYGVLSHGSPLFLQLLRNSLRESVPIDAIGIQAHEPPGMRFQLDHVWAMLDRIAELGKPLHVSELAIPSAGPLCGSYMAGNWDEQRQADYAVQFYRLCFGHPAVEAITWWDLSDRGAWHDATGLLRQDMSPKPAYEALRKLIRQQWWTQTTAQTDAHGIATFRGFLGDYRLQTTINGQPLVLDVTLAPGDDNHWDLKPPAPPAPQSAATSPSQSSVAATHPTTTQPAARP